MGVGHVAVGLGAKRIAPKVPLAVLLVAGVFLDLIWGVTILAGLEHARMTPGEGRAIPLELIDTPISHSLVATLGWSVLFAIGVALAVRRSSRMRAALVAGALVLSHWVLDVIAHVPDVPVGLHGPNLGLGLWYSRAGSIVVECAMVILGAWLYAQATPTSAPRGRTTLVVTTAVLVVVGAGAYLGPAPPSVTPLAVMNLAVVGICIGIGVLLDRRRPPRPA